MQKSRPVLALPHNYQTRFATRDDLSEVTALYRICEEADSGIGDYSVEEVRAEWEELQLDRDLPLILSNEGQIVGALQFSTHSGGSMMGSGYVHPAHTGAGLGDALVSWSERRALDDLNQSDKSNTTLIHATNAANAAAASLLTAHGFSLQKRFVLMRMEMANPPDEPELPRDYRFEPAGEVPDLPGFYSVIEESFRDHWSIAPRTYDNWKEMALGSGYAPAHWCQIVHKGEPVAVAIGLNDSREGWIRWVGVREQHRRIGLGRALMLDQLGRYWRAEIRRVGLSYDLTNANDPGRLYEMVGMNRVMVSALYERTVQRSDGR